MTEQCEQHYEKQPVTKGECEVRHKSTRNQLAFVMILIGLFMTGVGWAVFAGNTAASKSAVVEHHLQSHEATQEEMVKRIEGTLDQIARDVARNREELRDQRGMIEDLWRRNGGGHSSSHP
jgi:uncharacterized protein HemX